MSYFKFKAQDVVEEGRTDWESIRLVKDWMLEDEDLPKIEDEMVVLFLLSCNNKLEDTKNTIRIYYRMMDENPEFFDGRDVNREELKKSLNTVYFVSIPRRTKNNNVIHYFKLKDTYYGNLDIVPAIKLAFMLLDISLQNNPPNGLVVVLDMEGLGFMHLTRLKLGAMKKFFQFVQEAMPLKIKEIHILNTFGLFEKLMIMFKAFMKAELVQMIQTHPPNMNMDQFFELHVEKECISSDYGGCLAPLDELQLKNAEKFRELIPHFEQEEANRKARKTKP